MPAVDSKKLQAFLFQFNYMQKPWAVSPKLTVKPSEPDCVAERAEPTVSKTEKSATHRRPTRRKVAPLPH